MSDPGGNKKLTKRTVVAIVLALIVIPAVIALGIFVLDDRRFYFVSMVIILLSFLPFVMVFEHRKPQAREIVVIAALSAITVAGRAAFFMVPQFKPVVALVIIAGVSFGGEAGFLVGAVSGFVSNFFFGQGPWTPWQMFCYGLIGLLAGIIFRKHASFRNKFPLCMFGGFAAFFLYGGIMDTAIVLINQGMLTKGLLLAAYASGFWFNVIHGVGTALMLFFISGPMIEKLERIKIKYGLIEPG